MKLYAKIHDRESSQCERVVLCQFKDKYGDVVFVEDFEIHGEVCFKVLRYEGCVSTEYFYPIRRYSIIELEVY